VARFVDFPSDVRTTEALCRAAGLFVPERTFREWCLAEGVQTSALRDLARMLRAVHMARVNACRLEECFELDRRTLQSLLDRGGCREDWCSVTTSWFDVCRQQAFVRHPLLLETIAGQLMDEPPVR